MIIPTRFSDHARAVYFTVAGTIYSIVLQNFPALCNAIEPDMLTELLEEVDPDDERTEDFLTALQSSQFLSMSDADRCVYLEHALRLWEGGRTNRPRMTPLIVLWLLVNAGGRVSRLTALATQLSEQETVYAQAFVRFTDQPSTIQSPARSD